MASEINNAQNPLVEPVSGGSQKSILDVDGTDWLTQMQNGFKLSHTSKAYGTGIPFMFNLLGDLLINPSTIAPSTFKKMVETDNMIGACMRYNIDCIISSIGNYEHPVEEIQENMRLAEKKLNRGFKVLLRDTLQSTFMGYSNSEKMWEFDEDIGGDIIIDTQPLPQSTTIARVDPQGKLQKEGIGQYIFNAGFNGNNGMLGFGIGSAYLPVNNYGAGNGCGYRADPYASEGDADLPQRSLVISPIGLVWLPTDKIIKHTYYGTTNNVNPYGKSMLRHVYNLYVTKYALLQFMLRAIKTKSAPFLAVFARYDVPSGSLSPNDPDAARKAQVQSLFQQCGAAFEDYDSSNYMILPGMKGEGVDIESFTNEANIDVMLDFLRYIDTSIMSALMVPQTVFGGGGKEGGSFSLSQTHESVHARWVMSLRDDIIENVLIKQYIKPMIEELYVKEEHNYDWGKYTIGLISLDDQLKQTQIMKNAIDSGYVFPQELDDMNHMRELIDFKKMDKVVESFAQSVEKSSMSDRQVKDTAGDAYAHSNN